MVNIDENIFVIIQIFAALGLGMVLIVILSFIENRMIPWIKGFFERHCRIQWLCKHEWGEMGDPWETTDEYCIGAKCRKCGKVKWFHIEKREGRGLVFNRWVYAPEEIKNEI